MSAFQEYFNQDHQMVRDSVRRFVEREILPHVADWEEAEEFPRELYRTAGAAGILGIGYPEQFGGSHEGDVFAKVAASEELMRCGSGGLVAGLASQGYLQFAYARALRDSGDVAGDAFEQRCAEHQESAQRRSRLWYTPVSWISRMSSGATSGVICWID